MVEEDLQQQFARLAHLLEQVATIVEELSKQPNLVGTKRTRQKLDTVNVHLEQVITALHAHIPA